MTLARQLKERWVAGAGLLAIALISWQQVQLTDAWMYAATGRWVWENKAVPWSDPFTWTFTGRPWQSNGWLWGLLLYGVWAAGGLVAMAALKPLVTIGIGLSVRWAARTAGALPSAAAGGMLAGALFVSPYVAERPQLASYALYPLALGTTYRSLAGGRLRWGWVAATAGVFVLWTNLHSAALGGLPLVGALAAGIVLQRRPRTLATLARSTARAAAPVVAAALGSLVTPYSVTMWSYSSHVRDVSKATVSEWAYPWQAVHSSGWLEIGVILLVIGFTVDCKAWRRLDVLLPIVAAVALSLDAVRSVPMLALTAAVLLPVVVPEELVERVTSRRDLLRVGAAATLLFAAVIAVPRVAVTGDPAPDTPVVPTAALPQGCRLANDNTLGNWVLWSRPDLPTSVDGRNDVFGRDLSVYLWFHTPGDQRPVLDELERLGVTCALSGTDNEIVPALEAAGWEVVAEDSTGVALVAPSTS